MTQTEALQVTTQVPLYLPACTQALTNKICCLIAQKIIQMPPMSLPGEKKWYITSYSQLAVVNTAETAQKYGILDGQLLKTSI